MKRSPGVILLASASAFAVFLAAAGAGLLSGLDRWWVLDTSGRISYSALDAAGGSIPLLGMGISSRQGARAKP